MIKRGMGAFVAGLMALALPGEGVASGFCDLDTVLASYKAAYKQKKYGDIDRAHKNFLKLAEAGVAPAQRHVARYYLEESREDMALEKAVMWAQLAAWGGDLDAREMVKPVVQSVRYKVAETGMNWAKNWRPTRPNCYDGPNASKKEVKDVQVVGRYPIIRHEDVSEDVFVAFATRLKGAIDSVGDVAPYFAPLAQLIPAFEVLDGEGSDRYIRWQSENGWVQVSTGFLEDRSPRQLAYNLVLVVQRHLYGEISDAEFYDQISTRYGKIKIFGSLYGDVETPRFLSEVTEAIKQARELPVVLRDKVNFLDEIYYMPPSRYHHSRFPSTKLFSTYDHQRSQPQKRMMVVSHELAFQTPQQLILELVRAGEIAQQHSRIEALNGQVNGKARENAILEALQGDPIKVQEAFRANTAKSQKIVEQWEEKGPDNIERIYCASVYSQVKAAIALKMEPIHVTQSIKFKGCREARKAWREYRSGETKK